MKTVLALVTLGGLAFPALAQITGGDHILGTWLSEKKDGKIEVYKVGKQYFGKLVWGQRMYAADGKTPNKDVRNPDPNLRTRNYKDLVLLTNFVYDDGQYTDGKVYDTESGTTYRCVMKLKDNVLHIKGYVGTPLLGKTTEWTRVP